MPHKLCKSAVLLLLTALVLAACGGDNGDNGDQTSESPTETVESVTDTTGEATSTVSEGTSPEEPEISDEVALANKPTPDQAGPTQPPNPPSSFDSDGDGYYNLEELEEAVRARFPEYEWPEDFNITPDSIIGAFQFPESSMHEAPGEYTIIGGYHTCAWEITLLEASRNSDQELIDESLYQLVDFGQNKNPLSRDEEGKTFMQEMYNSAVLGDPADLQRWVNNNCDFAAPYFESSSQSPQYNTALSIRLIDWSA